MIPADVQRADQAFEGSRSFQNTSSTTDREKGSDMCPTPRTSTLRAPRSGWSQRAALVGEREPIGDDRLQASAIAGRHHETDGPSHGLNIAPVQIRVNPLYASVH